MGKNKGQMAAFFSLACATAFCTIAAATPRPSHRAIEDRNALAAIRGYAATTNKALIDCKRLSDDLCNLWEWLSIHYCVLNECNEETLACTGPSPQQTPSTLWWPEAIDSGDATRGWNMMTIGKNVHCWDYRKCAKVCTKFETEEGAPFLMCLPQGKTTSSQAFTPSWTSGQRCSINNQGYKGQD